MAFSQKLQEYRKAEKLSQEELAHRLGVSRQSVSKWEQGLSFPETEKLIELSSLMNVSIDALLKEEAQPEVEAKAGNHAVGRRWLIPVLIVLLIAAVVTIIAIAGRLDTLSNTLAEYAAEQETADMAKDDLPEKAETPPEENEVDETLEAGGTEDQTVLAPDGLGLPEPGFENKHLHDLQRWFFGFAQQYRLDYMPYFTQDEGAPSDSGEYLYWAYAINLDHWGDKVGTMTKEYVEETVQQHFGVIPGQHRSHRKSWDFNAETETYTAWPESLREKPYYLLNSIEVDGDCYTVHATCYSVDYLPSEEDALRLKAQLLDGENTEMLPVSEITVSFYLDYLSFHRPVFVSFEENFQMEMDAVE